MWGASGCVWGCCFGLGRRELYDKEEERGWEEGQGEERQEEGWEMARPRVYHTRPRPYGLLLRAHIRAVVMIIIMAIIAIVVSNSTIPLVDIHRIPSRSITRGEMYRRFSGDVIPKGQVSGEDGEGVCEAGCEGHVRNRCCGTWLGLKEGQAVQSLFQHLRMRKIYLNNVLRMRKSTCNPLKVEDIKVDISQHTKIKIYIFLKASIFLTLLSCNWIYHSADKYQHHTVAFTHSISYETNTCPLH